MDIGYKDNKICKYCLDNRLASSKFGIKVAKRLKHTIAVLNAASNMSEVKSVLPKTHWLQGDRHRQMSVPLADGKSLILETLNEETREWDKQDSIVIATIEDYHK